MYKPPNSIEVYLSKSEVLLILESVLERSRLSEEEIRELLEKADEAISDFTDAIFDQ